MASTAHCLKQVTTHRILSETQVICLKRVPSGVRWSTARIFWRYNFWLKSFLYREIYRIDIQITWRQVFRTFWTL